MITLDINDKKVEIKKELIFNSMLYENPKLIRKIIKSIYPLYRISRAFFEIVNTFVDFKEDSSYIYIGLIVRTSLDEYAVLYLEDSILDEEEMVRVIERYIRDKGDHNPKEININKFEVDENLYNTMIKNI